VRGHSVQPSPNAFGLLLKLVCMTLLGNENELMMNNQGNMELGMRVDCDAILNVCVWVGNEVDSPPNMASL